MARPRPLLYQVRKVKTPYHGKSWKVTAYIDGKRKQHWFASEREANIFADDSNAELHAYGSQLSDLSPSDRVDSQRALDILKGHPEVSLTELAKLYAAQAVARSASKPLDQFLIELHKTKGPVPFRLTQRDYKRQENLVSVDSLSKITFGDGLFKDETDLNGFLRWMLRCQAKREAGTLEP